MQTLDHSSLVAYSWAKSHAVHLRHRLATDDRGEGVISAAIVVLIMAFLGVAMWLAFQGLFDNAASETENQVEQIGGP